MATLISDTFTAANDTPLAGRTPSPTNTPGNAWADVKVITSASAASNKITSNTARSLVDNTGFVIDAGAADVTLACDFTVTPGGGDSINLILRYDSNGNMLRVLIRQTDGDVLIRTTVADVSTTIGSEDFAWAAGATYALRVNCFGSLIELWVDDQLLVSGTTALFPTATKHGIGRGAGVDATAIDNLTISDDVPTYDLTGAGLATVDPYVVGVPPNNAAFFDGETYWVFHQVSDSLRCLYGPSLASLAASTSEMPTGISNSGRAYSVLFGRVGFYWYAWALVNRSPDASGEASNVYRWRLTPDGLVDPTSHISTGLNTPQSGSIPWLSKDYGDANVAELLRTTSSFDYGINRQLLPGLTGDTDMGDWDVTGVTFPEAQMMFKLADGYITISNNTGDNTPDTPGAWERVKTAVGDAWGSETFIGWGDQAHAANTSHSGHVDFCQTDDGRIYGAYVSDDHADHGQVVLNVRGNTKAAAWSVVTSDLVGSGGHAWHIALATDGTDVWVFYVKDSGGSRASAISYKRYRPATGTLDAERTLAATLETFERMSATFRAAGGRIVVSWSEVDGTEYVLRAAEVLLATARVTAEFRLELLLGATWTDVTADVRYDPPPTGRYGMMGTGPADRVADTGTLTFALDNGPGNSAGLVGYYSPGHANARSGFDLGVGVRASFDYFGAVYYKFRGTLDEILPVPGQRGGRLTLCAVVDWMDEATKPTLPTMALGVNQRGNETVATVVDAMVSKPSSSTLATGRDIFPYVFDNALNEFVTPLSVFNSVAQSELGFIYLKGNTIGGGELVFDDRHARPRSGSALVTLADDMVRMTPRRSRAQVFNRVRAVAHPRRADASASILFTLQSVPQLVRGTAVAGSPLVIHAGYVDPSAGKAMRMGALTTCTLTPTVDYTMNSASDGSGEDYTSAFTVSASFGANSARVELRDNILFDGWVTKLQIRGRGLYDYEPIMLEAVDVASGSAYGENALPVDMPLQTNALTVSDAAHYLLQVWKNPQTRVERVQFLANESDTLMRAGLLREISDRIALAETVTGIDQDYFINGIEFQVLPKNLIEFSWSIVPTDPFAAWILGVAGAGELGVATRLGY